MIGWIHDDKFQGAEVLESSIAASVSGVFLGWAGAVLAKILDHFCRHSVHLTSRAEGTKG
jgi:hypothetical protein